MIRTLDFNPFTAGTVIDDEYANLGVTVSAVGGSNEAMIFDSSNPTGGDEDLASDTLDGLLIISEDSNEENPDDNAAGGSIFFDFEDLVRIKSLTFKDIEEQGGEGTRMIFYDENDNVISNQFVDPTGDGGERTVGLFVPGVARMEVRLEGSGAIDNLVFDDGKGDPGGNLGPDAVDDGVFDISEDAAATFFPLINDSDPEGDPIAITTASSDDGTVGFDGTSVSFQPDSGFTGLAEISYTITDGNGGFDTATIFVNVGDGGGGDTGPTAVDDEDTTDLNTPVIVDLRSNDLDPNDPLEDLTVTAATSPNGDVVDNGDGTVTFTPAAGFTGDAIINYTITDPDGQSDDGIATVTIADDGGDTGPTAVDDEDTTDINTPVIVDLRSNDTDPNDPVEDLTVTAATSPNGSVVDNGDGTVTFTPAAGFTGDAIINYTITDPDGQSDDGVATVMVADDGNLPPVAVDDEATTDEDIPLTITPLDNDSDPDGDPLTITDVSTPVGEVTTDGTNVFFTPPEDFNGPVEITYTVEDPDGATDTGTIDVTVDPVNDAPVAVDDIDSTTESTPVIVDLRGNDTDVDDPTEDLTIVEATSPDGTVVDNGDGTVTFTPDPDFIGDAVINYTVEDPDGLQDEGVATIAVLDDGIEPDGFVDGGDDGDLIDEDYDGDPNGDFIDNDDALLPGTEGDDDNVRAGGGDDTVIAGEGNDVVDGGDGDDDIDTGNGDLAPDLGYPFAATDPLGYDPDTDPEDDRDFVDGGAGDDTISTGDDRDTIFGGDGNDNIDGGIDDDDLAGEGDDDRIVGGEGNDSIFGGDGDDLIFAGNDPDLGLDVLDLPDEPTEGFPFSPDRQPLNGRDTVEGGAGNDTIFGADDDDLLMGGSGDDFVDGQIDDDTIDGNTGDDTLLGGQGDDSVEGGQGDDELDGGDGDDTLRGNLDDDTLDGGAGDDSLDGGGGDDVVEGGDGDDSITGNQGDDTLLGGEGADTMTGGAGQDVFDDVGAGDVIDGGSAPVDFDTLNLAGSAPDGGRFEITFTSDDREDGFVDYFNADGTDAGRLVFEEIENVVPCFTPGTKIATPQGERLVEELKVGDRIITRDNGMQEIRWIGARDMTGAELEIAPHLKPVLIQKGALGNDLPERDMMVSPQHRVLIANDKTALYFEEREVLVAAKHLTDRDGIDVVDVSGTTYIHIMFDQHEVVLSDGTWTESFQPGDMTLAGIGEEQRQEILELFPELETQEGIESYSAARRSLKGFEAKLLND